MLEKAQEHYMLPHPEQIRKGGTVVFYLHIIASLLFPLHLQFMKAWNQTSLLSLGTVSNSVLVHLETCYFHYLHLSLLLN